MVKVYFETVNARGTASCAYHVATFESEADYVAIAPALEERAKACGYDRISESIED